MTDKEFYKDALPTLEDARSYLLGLIEQYPNRVLITGVQSRIKSAKSMAEKLKRQGFDTALRSALEH